MTLFFQTISKASTIVNRVFAGLANPKQKISQIHNTTTVLNVLLQLCVDKYFTRTTYKKGAQCDLY
jgi:hypothetical protein